MPPMPTKKSDLARVVIVTCRGEIDPDARPRRVFRGSDFPDPADFPAGSVAFVKSRVKSGGSVDVWMQFGNEPRPRWRILMMPECGLEPTYVGSSRHGVYVG